MTLINALKNSLKPALFLEENTPRWYNKVDVIRRYIFLICGGFMGRLFTNDYSETCRKEILDAIAGVGIDQNKGYGLDVHSDNAEKLILKRFGVGSGGRVFFVSGGTQTNMSVLSFLLKPYEAVLACDSGHINVHETGAVEASGHKVVTVPGRDGKVLPDLIEAAVKKHCDEHMVKIKAVYVSDSTETGSIYTKAELTAIRRVCDKLGLLLFLDGARLGVALTCAANDIEPEFLGGICDVFYVGGTKNGMLFGEAIVFRDGALAEEFRYHVKNRGAMLAKGFVPGVMFERAFTDDLYFDIARDTNRAASHLGEKLRGKVEFASEPVTNQIFVVLDKNKGLELIDRFGCELWEDRGDTLVVRIVTSFATTKDDCDELIGFFGR